MRDDGPNANDAVVRGFGDEWRRFDQSEAAERELRELFDAYFSVFPWSALPPNAVGFDLGCGSGRWARFVAERVGLLHSIDAAEPALAVARRNLRHATNALFHHASVGRLPIPNGSIDLGYSLGVLHHVPDTQAGLLKAVAKLRRGAPFLLYPYYAFDNRPAWFRRLWQVSALGRRTISRLSHGARFAENQILAGLVYLAVARGAAIAERLGVSVDVWPLAAYRQRSFYVMRTDALDRFGTRLEQRFTRDQIIAMMKRSGLRDIQFRGDGPPYWVAVGIRA